MVKVKICGITNLEDAKAAVSAGCDALGFVFYKKSPRYITPKKAWAIIKKIPKAIIKVGVFVNARERTIKHTAKLCRIKMLQFHGNESPEFCGRFGNYKIIKAFRIKNKINLAEILKYKTFAYLFDTFDKTKIGGTGKRLNWYLLKYLEDVKQPIFVSGGLNADNVEQAIKVVRPEWVDASSSLEIKPGSKDALKVKKFILKAKKIALFDKTKRLC